MQAKTTPLSTEKGAMVLTSVALLLTMATLVTLYTGQIKSFENQITLNAQNRLLAFNSAEAGLMHALGILTIEP
ncbi:MAG: PilX N-terminal domain-containing pilus assembly protein, partial [Pseudomonadota bacterium]|nr:PilX N-terminal domain-containing pilus assembly protein [Pseudomonadota bacterium]